MPRWQKLEDRFWDKVELIPFHECWEWTGTQPHGYGVIVDRYKKILAHRFSWWLHNGPIPDDLCVLHRCDNPGCVNPDHLFLGDRNDNNQDCIAKGRARKAIGSKASKAKLTEQQVGEIKALLRKGELSCSELGSMYGIDGSGISRINTGKFWGHVN